VKSANTRTLVADTLTVFWKEWLELKRQIVDLIVGGLFLPTIYIIGFGFGLGSTLPPDQTTSIGNSYLEFIIPGMIAVSSMTISFGNTSYSMFEIRVFRQSFADLLLLPVSYLSLFLGKLLSGTLQGMITSIGVIFIAILFTGRIVSFLNPVFLLILLLTCAVFAGFGMIVGLQAQTLEKIGLYNSFLIVPMIVLSATFFDPTNIPPVLKVIVYLLPLTYASIGLRAAAYDLSQLPWYVIPILSVSTLVLSMIGVYQFSHQQD
jgi:ABC-2 type transport system permease protein